jgi:hypothetical protein
MTWPERCLEYTTLAMLVALAFTVAFCVQENSSIRTRLWMTRCQWTWAAKDTTSTSAVLGRTVTTFSTRQTAVRMLRDVIGDL